jgi:hypothetical protein
MKTLVLIAHVLIVIIFLLTGIPKLFIPIEDLISFGMLWMEDFSVLQITTIGILETLGLLGLTLPYLISALPKIIVPISSAGLGLTMIGAIITHIERQDPIMSIIITSIIFIMCVFVTLKRYNEFK